MRTKTIKIIVLTTSISSSPGRAFRGVFPCIQGLPVAFFALENCLQARKRILQQEESKQ